jgi:tetratricopeptide (TPR) repeat protein
MDARTAGDLGPVWGALTGAAQEAMTSAQVARHLRQEEVTYGALGSPLEVEPGVVRIPVQDLMVKSHGRRVTWPEAWLTLKREGDKWLVAWAEPLFSAAANAYFNTDYVEQLEIAGDIIAVDPYHYRGYLESHYAYRGLARPREAEVALAGAAQRATAVEQPNVEEAIARFQFSLKQPDRALEHVRLALDLAQPYIPDTYSARWQADTLVLGSRVAMALGDQESAATLAEQAAAVDPHNPELAILRFQLAGKQ